MKKLGLLVVLFPLHLLAQNSFPSYPDLLIEFLKHYSYTAQEPVDGINFAKKKDGWHVQVIDRISEKVKNDQVFWTANDQSYYLVTGFGAPVSDFELEDALTSMLQATGFFNVYSYERCRYYGYNHWTEDIFNQFGNGNKQTYSDTLLEGLARSYSVYGSKFLWYQFGGDMDTTDTLKRKLGVLEMPSHKRIDSVNYYIGKAVETFKILANKNNRYMTTVGNPSMKVFNEQMNGYMQMSMAGYNQLATDYIHNITPNTTLITLAKNFLSGCAPNAILFTFGDNDTYPLWYLQQKEKFRTDVAVINTSLLGLPVYIHMLNKNHVVDFSTSSNVYGDPGFLYFVKHGNGIERSGLTDFIKAIQSKAYPYESDWYGKMSAYTQSEILFSIDLARFKKIASQSNFSPQMKIKLGDYITNDQFMVLDIINSNIYRRPIYFAATYDLLSDYLQRQGLIYQLLPLDSTKTKQNEKISVAKIKSFLQNGFKATPSNNFSSGLVTDYNQDAMTQSMFTYITRYFLDRNNIDSALYFINSLYKVYDNNLPYTPALLDVAAVLLDAGRKAEGHKLLQQQIEFMFELYKKPSAYFPYMSRKTVLNTAISAQAIFVTYQLDRKRMDEIVSYLNKRDH